MLIVCLPSCFCLRNESMYACRLLSYHLTRKVLVYNYAHPQPRRRKSALVRHDNEASRCMLLIAAAILSTIWILEASFVS